MKGRYFFRIVKEKLYAKRIKNKNLCELVMQYQTYYKMKKEFQSVLEEGLQNVKKAEKSDYIWICWFQGFENAPDLVKACASSVFLHMPDRKMVLITLENLDDYIQLPDYIMEKWKKGMIQPAHFSDLIRIELLCKYGGIWLDATVLCTEPIPDYIREQPLFVFKNIDLNRRDIQPTIASNWFLSSWSNQRILLMTRKLLHEYWRKKNRAEHYYIFHIFFALSAEKYKEDWERIPTFNNHSPHILQFETHKKYEKQRWEQILHMSPLHKLNHHISYEETGTSFYRHILEIYGTESEKFLV